MMDDDEALAELEELVQEQFQSQRSTTDEAIQGPEQQKSSIEASIGNKQRKIEMLGQEILQLQKRGKTAAGIEGCFGIDVVIHPLRCRELYLSVECLLHHDLLSFLHVTLSDAEFRSKAIVGQVEHADRTLLTLSFVKFSRHVDRWR
ncbi:hypothetical protein BLNAU_9776 [Blattamonas nauphoetae]|uniref:Uncharacterized protein n=1 Tax=Blattamonas nauphoetae TaxID=2049346 RepID=A0ABQ9XUS1_9EUKA|nr:hypothetical protein BLNAU_9776 [Blattamonas nauphoetae]